MYIHMACEWPDKTLIVLACTCTVRILSGILFEVTNCKIQIEMWPQSESQEREATVRGFYVHMQKVA